MLIVLKIPLQDNKTKALLQLKNIHFFQTLLQKNNQPTKQLQKNTPHPKDKKKLCISHPKII